MANAGENRTINLKIGNNEALVSAFDDVIINNSELISPLKGRADENAD